MAPLWREEAKSVCLRLCGNEMEADDVAQEVMLRLWQMRERLDQIRMPSHFVGIVARNQWIDHCRRNRTKMLDIDTLQTEALYENPVQQLELRETEEWLEKTLKLLPTTQRAVLQLRQVEQRSHREIAQLLSISETSVSTLLARARRALLKEFEKRDRQ